MDSSPAFDGRRHSQTAGKRNHTLFPAKKHRHSRRASSSSSSLSSLSSCSSSLESPYIPDDSPISYPVPFRSSGVPFSWENFPGIPKKQTPVKKEKSSPTNLPLPPTLTPPTSKRFHFEPTKKVTQTDPFFAALVECSKDEDHQLSPETNRKFSDGPKVSSRSISDRIGLINLYSSCKRTCAVYESKSCIPRSSRRGFHGYDLINSPTAQSRHRPPECQAQLTTAAKYD